MASLSIVHGSTEKPLYDGVLEHVVNVNAGTYGGQTALIVPSLNMRLSFNDVAERTWRLALSIQESLPVGDQDAEGAWPLGDNIGVLAGNRLEVLEIFIALGRLGRVFASLNPAWTPDDLCKAVKSRDCRVLFLADKAGSQDLKPHRQALLSLLSQKESILQKIVLLDSDNISETERAAGVMHISELPSYANLRDDDLSACKTEQAVRKGSHLCLQFSSGTTGDPKAILTDHGNNVNAAKMIGENMNLKPGEVVCAAPPLFRPFGLIMGFLAAYVSGAACVIPCEEFDAAEVARQIALKQCTVLVTEPQTMEPILKELQDYRGAHQDFTLRIILTAGVVSDEMRRRYKDEIGLQEFVVGYGQTETTALSFATSNEELIASGSVGQVLPHTNCQIVDIQTGKVLPREERGEIWVQGHGVMYGFYGDRYGTEKALWQPPHGGRFHRSGDEGWLDEHGNLFVTGRIKDIVFTTQGEKVYPGPAEARLLQHEDIEQACIVGVGEEFSQVVVAVLGGKGAKRPSVDELRRWVNAQGRLDHVVWLGDPGIVAEYPTTYNAKVRRVALSLSIASAIAR